jgi:hypothetical protein
MMYRRPKFLEILLDIRQQMSREADYDVDLFAEMVRADRFTKQENRHNFEDARNAGEKSKDES